MNNIIVGVKRSAGSFESKKDKQIVKYDNVNVYLMNVGDSNTKGYTLSDPEKSIIKVKYTDFERIFGVTLGQFVKDFDEKYANHRAKVFYEQDNWGELIPSQVLVSEKRVDELLADEAEERARKEEEAALLMSNQGNGRKSLLDE